MNKTCPSSDDRNTFRGLLKCKNITITTIKQNLWSYHSEGLSRRFHTLHCALSKTHHIRQTALRCKMIELYRQTLMWLTCWETGVSGFHIFVDARARIRSTNNSCAHFTLSLSITPVERKQKVHLGLFHHKLPTLWSVRLFIVNTWRSQRELVLYILCMRVCPKWVHTHKT